MRAKTKSRHSITWACLQLIKINLFIWGLFVCILILTGLLEGNYPLLLFSTAVCLPMLYKKVPQMIFLLPKKDISGLVLSMIWGIYNYITYTFLTTVLVYSGRLTDITGGSKDIIQFLDCGIFALLNGFLPLLYDNDKGEVAIYLPACQKAQKKPVVKGKVIPVLVSEPSSKPEIQKDQSVESNEKIFSSSIPELNAKQKEEKQRTTCSNVQKIRKKKKRKKNIAKKRKKNKRKK